jgi:hypothetical protein
MWEPRTGGCSLGRVSGRRRRASTRPDPIMEPVGGLWTKSPLRQIYPANLQSDASLLSIIRLKTIESDESLKTTRSQRRYAPGNAAGRRTSDMKFRPEMAKTGRDGLPWMDPFPGGRRASLNRTQKRVWPGNGEISSV